MIQSSLGQWWNRAERTVAELTCGKSSGMFATTVLLMRPESAGFNFWDAALRVFSRHSPHVPQPHHGHLGCPWQWVAPDKQWHVGTPGNIDDQRVLGTLSLVIFDQL